MTNTQQLERQLLTQSHLLDDPLALHEELVRLYSAGQGLSESERQKTLLQALERCTQMLVDDRRYANDVRYFRIWMQYAKLCTDPLGIFDFLHQRRLFRDIASFYEEWARLALSSRGAALAQQVLQRGIAHGAQPLERLRQTLASYASGTLPAKSAVKRDSWENGTSVAFFSSSRAAADAVTGSKTASDRKEVSYYDPALIENGKISFEQARLKYLLTLLPTKTAAQSAQTRLAASVGSKPTGEDDGDEDVPGLCQPINPDELTHISVFKDSTADVSRILKQPDAARELAKIAGELVHSVEDQMPFSSAAILPRLVLQVGGNATAPATKTLIGHFYLESCISGSADSNGERLYVAVDVSSDKDVPQKVALHVVPLSSSLDWTRSAYEAAFLLQHCPQVAVRTCRYADAILFSHVHHPGGTLAALMANARRRLHPIVGLHFVRELAQQLASWHQKGTYHGGLSLAHCWVSFGLPRCTLVPLGMRPWDSTARGVQADVTGLEAVAGALLKHCCTSAPTPEWSAVVQAFQQRQPVVGELLGMLDGLIQGYRAMPSLKSLLNRMELDVLDAS